MIIYSVQFFFEESSKGFVPDAMEIFKDWEPWVDREPGVENGTLVISKRHPNVHHYVFVTPPKEGYSTLQVHIQKVTD